MPEIVPTEFTVFIAPVGTPFTVGEFAAPDIDSPWELLHPRCPDTLPDDG